jgi:hypothetical protein
MTEEDYPQFGSVQSEHTLLAYGLNIFAIPETLSRARGYF